MLDIRLDSRHGVRGDDKETSFNQEIPAGEEGFVYVISGKAHFNSGDMLLSAGQVGHLAHSDVDDGPTLLKVTAKEPTRVLLLTGRPLRQSVVAHGPFVMNTKSQLSQAF